MTGLRQPDGPETERRADEYAALVDRLAGDGPERTAAYQALVEAGPPAREAVRAGLRHGHWQVRRWCALWFDHHADPASLHALVPLLRDSKAKVRHFAVHAIACDRCKAGENPVDVVPLLVERIREDESLRVRRHAVVMLAFQHAHPDLEAFFRELLETETDRRLRLHAGIGLLRCREKAGKPASG